MSIVWSTEHDCDGENWNRSCKDYFVEIFFYSLWGKEYRRQGDGENWNRTTRIISNINTLEDNLIKSELIEIWRVHFAGVQR